MASAYQASVRTQSGPPPPPACLPMQKKILENVLECIVQLKADFFDNDQPINDDSIVLQRFCAKFEHFLQIGMKEKVSLLGRKKDYWDYFCDCLGASKGINDGIKYVKSLGENKTSLGKGRAFIRFCLVHQRLADMMQQCVVNDKTFDWFIPGTLVTNSKECQHLINSLYDLNSLHFDLSPRGYDLDTSWPAFSNRKHAGSGSWNVPLSRRSSMTSMDAISNISVSVDNNSEVVDRLAKDLETAQSTTSDLSDFFALPSHVKLKLEKDHQEKSQADLIRTLNAKFEEESSRRVNQLAEEEQLWKKERKEEASRMQKEIDRLSAEAEEANSRADTEQSRAEEQIRMLHEMLSEADIKSDNGDFRASLSSLVHTVKELQLQLAQLRDEKSVIQNQLSGEQTDNGKKLSLLEGRLLERERALREAQDASSGVQTQATKLELELKNEQDRTSSLQNEKSRLESALEAKEAELKTWETDFGDLRIKVSELELKNANLATERDYLKSRTEKTEALSSEIKVQLEMAKSDLVKANLNAEKCNAELARQREEWEAQLESGKAEINHLQAKIKDKEMEIENVKKTDQEEASKLLEALEKKDEELAKLRVSLDGATKKLDLVSKEAADLGEGNLVLVEKLALAEAEVETLHGGCRDVEEKVVNLEGEVEKMIQESHEKDAKLADMASQNDLLRQEVEEKVRVVESMESQVMNLDQQMKGVKEQKKEELEKANADLAVLRVEKEELKRNMEVEKERMLGLLKESEGVKRSENEKEEKIASLILEVENLRREKETDVTQLEERARVLNCQINERDQKVSELSKMVENLNSELVQVKEAKGKLETNAGEAGELTAKLQAAEARFANMIAQMDSQASEERQHRENEVASFTDRIKYLETQLADREKFHNASCNDYETKIAELKKKKDELECASSGVSQSTEKMTLELATLSEDKTVLESKFEAAESERLQLQASLAEMSQQVTEITAELNTSSEDSKSLKLQIETMAEDLTQAEDARDDLERQVAAMKEQLRSAEDEAQEKLSQKRNAELQLEEVQSKLEEMESRWRNAESKLEEAESEQQSLQRSKFSAQVLEESLVEARKALEEVRSERSQLQGKQTLIAGGNFILVLWVSPMSDSPDSLTFLTICYTCFSVFSDMEKLSEQLEEERRKSRMTVETLNEEISALQFQLSAEQMQKSETQGDSFSKMEENRSKSELKAVISDQEIIIERLEQELEAAQESQQAESSQVRQQRIKICAQYLEEIRVMVNFVTAAFYERRKLESELTSLRTTFSKSIEDKTAIIKDLESDNAQYRKKLVKLIKDKDTLWHKTDELVTAQKRKSEERWQDNAQVSNCTHCKTEFSLFVRKHHCRLCGRIFCWSCSDFWLDSTLSSKKVRTTFDTKLLVSENGAAQLSASMIANESDDDEDDEGEKTGVEGKEGERSKGVQDADSSSDGLARGHRTVSQAVRSEEDASGGDDDGSNDSNFQVVSQEEIEKSMSLYSRERMNSAVVPPNMTSSMILTAEELESGEVNQQNEVWIKPGKTFVVPVDIGERNTVLHWSFTSQPKDIVFSVTYRSDDSVDLANAEEVVAPCKCDSHKQTVRGELSAKQAGIYSLVFDNTYSKLTSKKVHYWLDYKKDS
ncbi:hypothetical protein EGW08_018590 [Elysia chlorotica]|uniref:RUN and FYVE domain-containing protein 4 n=1 Tax=Elysia chlorotica TaxID=188477 RepID=A0A3S0ZFD6_ELYCH|nr:hypothetical protein EGW08_018590 [Elysia chlorotica]